MNLLSKIEDFINALIIKFTELMMMLVHKLTPPRVKRAYAATVNGIHYVIHNFKAFPGLVKAWLIQYVQKLKGQLFTVDYKGEVLAAVKKAQDYYKAHSASGVSKFKSVILAPYFLVAGWLEGLSPAQAVMLLAFTAASVLAGLKIFSSGQRLAKYEEASRSPASVEEITYDRPAYYKKDSRHVLFTNIRLPVYIGGVNDLRSVDIDFNVTVSNRMSRIFLEKYEFQLRDYLILHIEPLVAHFPLEEEGREILKKKLWLEIDNFLKEHEIEGHVEEVKVTYVLAN